MEPQFIRAYRDATELQADGPITFVASTEDIARDGFSIAHDAWSLKNFNRNPLFLWAHNYGNPPIGKVKASIDKDAKALKAVVTFDLSDPFAADIYRKYQEGFLNAVSVGFDITEIDGKGREETDGWFYPRQGSVVTKAELLELSGVPVPADPKALAERMQRGVAADLTELINRLNGKLSNPDPNPKPDTDLSELVWRGTALSMAQLFLDTGDDDETREAEYRRLKARYDTLGKEPPEWMTRSELSLLDEPRIRELFGAGEAELLGWEPDQQRKGAVLSARNAGDLDQIITLAQGIKERATKEAETPEEDTERSFLQNFAAIHIDLNSDTEGFLRRLAG